MTTNRPLPLPLPASAWGAEAAKVAANVDRYRDQLDPRLEADDLAAALAAAAATPTDEQLAR